MISLKISDKLVNVHWNSTLLSYRYLLWGMMRPYNVYFLTNWHLNLTISLEKLSVSINSNRRYLNVNLLLKYSAKKTYLSFDYIDLYIRCVLFQLYYRFQPNILFSWTYIFYCLVAKWIHFQNIHFSTVVVRRVLYITFGIPLLSYLLFLRRFITQNRTLAVNKM